MSKAISPTAIGGFTIGALALLIMGILIFGGGQFFNKNKAKYVIFFDSSLNGLEVGAPVKMQGVKIGSVKEIVLQIHSQSGKVYKPVVVEIEGNNFVDMEGKQYVDESASIEQQIKDREKLVATGFRARLEMQSLLTGLLYVDFDRHQDELVVYTGLNYNDLLELPAVPTTVDQLRSTISEIIKRVDKLPLENIIIDTAATMSELRKLLESDEIKQSQVAMAKTLNETEKAVAILNRHLDHLLKDTHQTIQSTQSLIKDSRTTVQDVHKELRPLFITANKALNEATLTLEQSRGTLAGINTTLKGFDDTLGPESSFNDTLQTLNKTARSVKDLSDYLERHPESLLSGKEK